MTDASPDSTGEEETTEASRGRENGTTWLPGDRTQGSERDVGAERSGPEGDGYVMSRRGTEPTECRPDDGVGAEIDGLVRGAGRRLFDLIPRLERPLRLCRDGYAVAYVRTVALRHRLRHAAPIDPFRIIRVNPDRIRRLSAPAARPRFQRVGAVVDGDWDRREVRFVETDLYRSFAAHFRDGVPWERTAFFERVVEEIREGRRLWGCDSEAAFERRCRDLDELYASLREDGFRTQRELVASGRDEPASRDRATLAARIINDEVAVDIGRDGDLLYADGRNRLAMAKLLGVDEIPVIVLRRHVQWVDARDDAARCVKRTGRLPPALEDHPDVTRLAEDD